MGDSFEGINPDAEDDLQQAIEQKIVSGGCAPFSKADYEENYVCDTRISPAWLIGAGVSICRQWFGSEERLSIEERPKFLWRENPEESEVYIAEDDNWDFETVGKKPAIIVDLSDVSHVAEGAKTILGGDTGGNTLLGHIPESGELIFGSWDSGMLLFRCFAKSRLEAYALAWEVKSLMQSFAAPIEAAYEFKDFEVQSTSRPARMKDPHEGYLVSTVAVRYSIQDTWALTKESLKVQSICPTISTDSNQD